jgi:hypothetical protein
MEPNHKNQMNLLRQLSIDERYFSQFEEDISQIETRNKSASRIFASQTDTNINHFNERKFKSSIPANRIKFSTSPQLSPLHANKNDVNVELFFSPYYSKSNDMKFLRTPVRETKLKMTEFIGNPFDDLNEETRVKPVDNIKKSPSKNNQWESFLDSPDEFTKRKMLSSQLKSQSRLRDKEKMNWNDECLFDDFLEELRIQSFCDEQEESDQKTHSSNVALNDEGVREVAWKEELTVMMNKYLNSELVKKDYKYVQLWLDYLMVVDNPEEVLVYMHSRGIGILSPEFYVRWWSLYLHQKEFIYAYQVIELFEKQKDQIISKVKSEQILPNINYEHHISSLIKNMKSEYEFEVVMALRNDFYNKSYFINEKKFSKESYKQQRNVIKKYGIQPGISEEDFECIRNKNVSSRVNEVLQQVYGFDELYCKRLSDSIMESSLSDVLSSDDGESTKMLASNILNNWREKNDSKIFERLSQSFRKSLNLEGSSKRKRLSDLFAKKQYENSTIQVYIDERYRTSFQAENQLGLEYEFYKLKFKMITKKNAKQEKQKYFNLQRDLGVLSLNEQFFLDNINIYKSFKQMCQSIKEEFFIKIANQKRVKEMLEQKIILAKKKLLNGKKKKLKKIKKKTINTIHIYKECENSNSSPAKHIRNSTRNLLRFSYRASVSIKKEICKELPRFSS